MGCAFLGAYRYGFNGKEKDTDGEWGELTHYDYGFRIYNPGIGKFLSVDPLMKDYPSWTPYAFAMNRVIDGIDLDGLEFIDADEAMISFVSEGRAVLKLSNMSNSTIWRIRDSGMKSWSDSDGIEYIGSGVNQEVGQLIYEPLWMKHARAPDLTKNGFVREVAPSRPGGGNAHQKRLWKRELGRSGMKPGGRYQGPTLPTGSGKGLVIVYGVVQIARWYDNHMVKSDLQSAEDQLLIYGSAVVRVIDHAIEAGLIPKEFQDPQFLSQLSNFVFQGELYGSTLAPEIKEKLISIGQNLNEKLNTHHTGKYLRGEEELPDFK